MDFKHFKEKISKLKVPGDIDIEISIDIDAENGDELHTEFIRPNSDGSFRAILIFNE